MKKYIIASSIAVFAFASIAGAQSFNFSNDLKVGASGDDVVKIQEWLISNGYDIPSISSSGSSKGYFGNQTKMALIRYQVAAGLPSTGFFGPMTRGKWNSGNSDGRGESLRITSPNGGEVWQKGTTHNITWISNTKPGLTERFNKTADIKLAYAVPECAKPGQVIRCMIAIHEPLTIAKGVSLSDGSYAWNVGHYMMHPNQPALADCYGGNVNDCQSSSSFVPDGQYTIQICPTNGTKANESKCDESDANFTITSGVVSNKTPVINGVDAPTTLTVGQVGTWTVRASDPSNGTLSYSVNWGDVNTGLAMTSTESSPVFQNTTFTHSYSSVGTYTVTFTVRNSPGLSAQTSSTVVVRSQTSTGWGVTVTSPNGGEVWQSGSTKAITWGVIYPVNTSGQLTPIGISLFDIYLDKWEPCPGSNGSGCISSLYVLDRNISSSANYNWIVATDINNASIPAGTYKVRICLAGSTTNCDSGNGAFTITSATTAGPLKITSPNGGEVWQKGTTKNITWTAPAYFRATYADIKIVPSAPPCPMYGACPAYMMAPYTIASNIPINQNSYSWNIGYVRFSDPTRSSLDIIPDGPYTIQICETGTNNCDSSDGPFMVSSVVSTNLPDINITSPNGGESWAAGTSHNITVNVTGDQSKIGAYIDIYLSDSSDVKQATLGNFVSGSSVGSKAFTVNIPWNVTPGNYKVYTTLSGYPINVINPNTYGTPPSHTIQAYDYSDGYISVTAYVPNCPTGYYCTVKK